MNTKVVYAAGIVILIIGIAFYFINSGFFPSENSISSVNNSKTNADVNTVESSSPLSNSNIAVSGQESDRDNQNQNQQPQQQQQQQKTSSNYDNLVVGVKSVDVVPVKNVSNLQISFSVHNPNRGAAILETLTYGVYLDNVRLVSADIGSKPEGFIDSLGSVFPIIGNQTITLKDTQALSEDGSSMFSSNGTLIQNSPTSPSDSSVAAGKTEAKSYVINGTTSTSLHRGTQSQSSETPFSFQFPLK
jgi:hypothetical protein